jgi:isoleucyl-tRNA synthetase
LAHTCEETWSRIPGVSGSLEGPSFDSVHVQRFDVPNQERLEEIEGSVFQARFAAVLETRSEISAAFEQWKGTDGIKDSQDAVVTATVPPAKLELLNTFSTEELAIYFRMSWVELSEGETSYSFAPSPYPKCERSRLRRPDVAEVNGMVLTERDRRALGL